MSEMNIEVLFEYAIRWETQARDLYLNLATLFRHEPKVSEFWVLLSEDETRHIELLQETLDMIPIKERESKVSDKLWNVVLQVDEFLKEASNVQLLTLEDAYELAHKIENSEVNAIFRLLTIDLIPERREQKIILAQVTEHINSLFEFGREFPQANRKLISVQP